MGIATVTFKRCVQNAENTGGDEEHIVSHIYFDLELDQQKHTDVCLEIKQPIQGDAPIEVSKPHGYTGAGEFSELREAAAAYYKKLVGTQPAKEIPAQNNLIVQEETVEFEV